MRAFTLGLIIFAVFLTSCGKTQLFQENSNNWLKEGDSEWIFEDGEIIGTASNTEGFLMTTTAYRNFELELEFKPDSTINSGIFIRCKEQVLSPADCYEINIWDLHPNQEFRTGAIVTRQNPLNFVETIGQWNTYKISVADNHIQAWINGVLVADLTDQSLTDGLIAIQASGNGEVRFRNIRIQSIN